jgi:YD repeat-containing protein
VYDANDNVRVSTAPNGAVTTAEYDAADQLTFTLAPLDRPTDPQRKTSYTYDKVGPAGRKGSGRRITDSG